MPTQQDGADELVELERARLDALVRADMDVAEQLHADEYQLITPGGVALSKRDYLDGVASRALHYRVFEPVSEPAVKLCGDLAVLRYRARIEMDLRDGAYGGLFWHTDAYERVGDRWLAVWSQATRVSG